jgi:hypothetical protein
LMVWWCYEDVAVGYVLVFAVFNYCK